MHDLKLGLFGFVFIGIVHSYLFVVHCETRAYIHFAISEIGFVLHNLVILIDRRSHQMEWRVNNMNLSKGVTKTDVPLISTNLRKWDENRGFFGGNKFVSTYMERDKKNMEKWIFALAPLRF
ncbi:hypothetical protein ES703_87271 [subsurface metagenome]